MKYLRKWKLGEWSASLWGEPSRPVFLGVITFGLFLMGLATLEGAFLALALPCAVFLMAGVALGVDVPQLSLERSLSTGRVEEGTPVEVQLVIANRGKHLEQAWIEDRIPRGLTLIEGETRRLVSLSPGDQVELSYTVHPNRGVYRLAEVQIEVTNFLGLTRSFALLSAPETLWVLPRVVRLPSLHIQPRQTLGSTGMIQARYGGPGVSFYGLRNYHPGDELRWVNWRASQRHPGMMYTNEFEQERAANVGIILDARQSSHLIVDGRSLFESSIVAAASLAQTFLEDGNRVGLMLYGQSIDWTFPGYGKLQRERVMQSLARAQVGESEVLNNLRYLPTRIFSSKSQFVLVSPLLTDDVEFLMRLRARGYSVLLISPDPVSFEIRGLKKSESVRLAGRLVRLERSLLIRQLQQAGVEVLDWDVSIPLDQAIYTYGRWRRGQGVSRG